MVRDENYFKNVLRSEYDIDKIFDVSDIEELIAIVSYDHVRRGCGLSPTRDIAVLREVLRGFMAENIARREGQSTIGVVNNVIRAINPPPGSSAITTGGGLVEFAARINSELMTPEYIGGVVPMVACDQICKMYYRQREEEGDPVPEHEKFNMEEFAESGFGQGLSRFGQLLAKNIQERLKREGKL